MSLSLLERLDSLVKLLVLQARALLLERLHLLLLLQQAGLHLGHVLVRLEHLREEVVRARDGNLRLHEDLHALLHVLPREVVEGDLALDVVVDRQLLGHDQRVLARDGHVLREGDAPLRVGDQLLRGEAVVEVCADLAQTLQQLLLLVDCAETELLADLGV